MQTIWMNGIAPYRPSLGQFDFVKGIAAIIAKQGAAAAQAQQQAQAAQAAAKTQQEKAAADQAKAAADKAKAAADQAQTAANSGNLNAANAKIEESKTHVATSTHVLEVTATAPTAAPVSGGGTGATPFLIGGGVLAVGAILFSVLR